MADATLEDGMARRTPGGCWPNAGQQLLLRAALLSGAAFHDAWQRWRSAADLDRLDEASSGLLPLVGRNLVLHGLDSPDRRYFQWLHHGIWAANVRRITQTTALLQRFRSAGIDTLLLKGAALVSTAYDDPGLRPMGDVDVLVPVHQARQAMGLLREDGWRPVGWAACCSAPEMTVPVRHSHAYLRSADEQIDLHWHVLWESCEPSADEAFWRDSVAVEVDHVETRVLGDTHQFLHACAHGAQWSEPRNLRWVADAMTLLARPSSRIDWDRLVLAARDRGVALPVRDAVAFLNEALDAGIPDRVLESLQAARVSAIERWRYTLQVRPRGRLGSLPLLACHQWCLARRAGQGVPLVGLPWYLRQMYEVEHMRQVGPLLAHAVRRRAVAEGIGDQ